MPKNRVLKFTILIFGLTLLAGCGQTANNAADSAKDSAPINQGLNLNINQPVEPVKPQTNMPETVIDQNKSYTAVLHTMAGDIQIALNVKETPITANNFVWLAKKNFYDNTIFHRAIKGFMIQGGDPKGDGTGGPGYQFADETFTGQYSRGTVAMANAGPNTNGSQFFIMHADYPLPSNYVIFGQVTKGLDVVDKIAEAPVVMSSSGEQSKPVNPVKVNSVEIIEK